MFDLSVNTRTRSPGSMRYCVAGNSSDCNAPCIIDSATKYSISILASLSASNLYVCVGFVMDGPGNVGNTPKTNKDGTSPLGPMVSLMDLLDIRSVI